MPACVPARSEGTQRDAWRCQLALRLVGQVADALKQGRNVESGDGVTQVEQDPVALDNALNFRKGIEACSRGAVAMVCACAWTKQDSIAVALRTHAPFHVLPVERIVVAAGAHVAAQQRGAKQTGAAARAKAGTRATVWYRVKDADPGGID